MPLAAAVATRSRLTQDRREATVDENYNLRATRAAPREKVLKTLNFFWVA
jgi:hypothetical protein